MKIEVDVEIPAGYAFDGYRIANKGDLFLGIIGDALTWTAKPSFYPIIILRKLPKRYRVFEFIVSGRTPERGDFFEWDGGMAVCGPNSYAGHCNIFLEVTDQVQVTEKGEADE